VTDALIIKDLSLRIGNTQILSKVNLTLRQGEVTGLIGRSGSGKSMTALAAMGLAPSGARTAGEIRVGDETILAASEQRLCDLRGREIAMVFQEPMTALNPLQTIESQVAEVYITHESLTRAEASAKARIALARAGLPSSEVDPGRRPHELSGGQRQRAVIAMAIAMNPKVLLADEPTTALDVTTQAEILDLLKSLAKEDGCALLFITHDLAVVSHICDHIAVMKQGEIVSYASADAFYAHADSNMAREFIPASVTRPLPKEPQSLANSRAPLLNVGDLSCTYANARKSMFSSSTVFKAVEAVNFSITRGENVGLVGESGSGKSTIARALLGLHPVSTGSVSITGEELPVSDRSTMRRIRRKIQIVFQDPYSSFNPRHKVADIIAEPLHLLDSKLEPAQKRERVTGLIESVGLSADALDKYPHAFSGGQRQRIAIARALATDPELIVLDEATSALDIASRNHILTLLQSLSTSRGISLLVITHDLSVVRDITDRVMIMKDGRIVESGPTKQIFDAPEEDYTKKLIAASPVIRWRHDADPNGVSQ